MKTITKAIGATIAVGALTLAGVGTALAADITDTPVSLTIHQYERGDVTEDPLATGAAGDESSVPKGAKAVEGIIYTVTPVLYYDGEAGKAKAIDLTTSDGWGKADAIIKAFDKDGTVPTNLGEAVTLPATDDEGKATLLGATQTLYLVEQKEDGFDRDKFKNTILMPVKPFLITLPYPGVDTNGDPDGTWIYDVHAYPKFTSFNVHKELVSEEGNGLGSDKDNNNKSTWKVTVDIPLNTANVKAIRATDILPPELTYQSSSVSFLDKDGDAVSIDTVTPTYVSADHKVNATYTLGDTDRSTLAGGKMILTVETSTHALGTGDVTNQAQAGFTPESGGEVETTPNDESGSNTHWGALKITKEDGNSHDGLNGADFQIYASTGGTDEDDACASGNVASTPVQVGTATTFTTAKVGADDGVVVIAGLNAGTDTSDGKWYCVKETKAPAGYELASDYQPVKVEPNDGTDPNELVFPNVQITGPNLPGLGSTGSTIALAFGAALIVGGAGYLALNRRKAAEKK